MGPITESGIGARPFKLFLTTAFQTVSKDQNTREVTWLQKEPEKLLAHYQYIIESTVSRFISRGFFRAEEKMEVVQEINVELLEKKMARMREQYNGSVYLRTYFSRIVYNSCLEIARGRKRQPQILSTELLAEETSAQLSPIEALAIRDEMHRLEALLKGRRQYYKLKLCFKLWVRSPLHREDWQFFDGPGTGSAIARLKEKGNGPGLSEKEAFGLANELFNLLEKKETGADSLRRWVQQQAAHFIELLNGEPPISRYDQETFKTLLRYYFGQNP